MGPKVLILQLCPMSQDAQRAAEMEKIDGQGIKSQIQVQKKPGSLHTAKLKFEQMKSALLGCEG